MDRFTNKSPGALTMEQAIARHKKSMEEYKRQLRQVRQLAAQGRGEDTEIAHVALGELVVPRALQSPEVIDALQRAAAENNIPLEMLRVGNAANRINPNTGQPEFGLGMWLSGMFGGKSAAAAEDAAEGMAVDVPPLPESAAPYLPKGWDALPSDIARILPERVNMISALQNTNVRAGLDAIRRAEGGAVNRWTRGQEFTPGPNHPGPRPGNSDESAAGLYQMTRPTFDNMQNKVGRTNFEETGQNLTAAALLDEVHALDALRNGDFNGFMAGASKRWAAIPEGPGALDRTHKNLQTHTNNKNVAKPYASVNAWYQNYLNQNLRR
jgi:hypothetical protein